MATRSAIGIKHGDRVKSVYCHWDGYPEHNGAILQEFYSSSPTVNKLISMGDMSSLGATVGEKIEFGTRWTDDQYIKFGNTHAAPQCTFYSRDRGEDDIGANVYKDFADYVANHQYEEYEYIYRTDGRWYVCEYGGEYRSLEQALAELAVLEDQ